MTSGFPMAPHSFSFASFLVAVLPKEEGYKKIYNPYYHRFILISFRESRVGINNLDLATGKKYPLIHHFVWQKSYLETLLPATEITNPLS